MAEVMGFIFDMDGTLVDTERVATMCWKEAAKEIGFSLDEKLLFSMKGASIVNAEKSFDAFYHGTPSFAKTRAIRDRHFQEYIHTHSVSSLPGAKSILSFLTKNDYRLCLATSSMPEYGRFILAQAGLWDFFTYRVFGNEVMNGKPNPEIFLKASIKMGLQPCQCYVIEDSKNGIMAGKSGGFHVVGIPNAYPFDEETLAACELTFSSLDGFLHYLDK